MLLHGTVVYARAERDDSKRSGETKMPKNVGLIHSQINLVALHVFVENEALYV
jgi:hypothetical protein